MATLKYKLHVKKNTFIEELSLAVTLWITSGEHVNQAVTYLFQILFNSLLETYSANQLYSFDTECVVK